MPKTMEAKNNKMARSKTTKVVIEQPPQVLTFRPPHVGSGLNKTGGYKLIKAGS